MPKLKIALVSYINTIPFIEGIKASKILNDKIELIIDYPAKCAELIKNNQVDGGLIPIGALHEIENYKTFTNFCIGANGAVDTVALFSHQPFDEIKTIYLDYQSRTSVQLVQILAKKYWEKEFIFLPTTKGFEENIPYNSAILIIGDRVFNYGQLYKYKIDLAEEWKKQTNLPFAFAVWVGNKHLVEIENELNLCFEKSISRIPNLYNDLLTIDQNTFINYLSQSIDYSLDSGKKKAIQLFTSLLTIR